MQIESNELTIPFHPLSLSRVQNIFFLNGLAALIGWNSVLASMDYFSIIYSHYNVYLYFPIAVFVANAITVLLFNLISQKFGFPLLVKSGIIGTNIGLVSLLIVSVTCQEDQVLGFSLSLAICFWIGTFSNLCQLSFYGLINYFGGRVVSRFTIGTAVGGLVLVLIRALITGVMYQLPKGSVVPIVMYFVVAIGLNFLDLALNIRLFSSIQYSKNVTQKLQNQSKTRSYSEFLWRAFKATVPYPLLIFFNYIGSFMLFPDLTFAKKTSLGLVWTSILLLTMHNLGDFLGKLIGDFRGSFNSRSIKYLFVARLIFFFYTIPLMDKQFTQADFLLNNNVFPFFNQLLFGMTNGLVVNGCFILAYEKSPPQYRKFAGILCGILLEMGIMMGSFLAVPLEMLVKPDLQ